ncbi:MAG: hypothetical protein CRU72_10110 [Candidatus Accumulibacter phosphatis]|nr:hypothetical protein [Candidatus Accumulibacter phosphatis]
MKISWRMVVQGMDDHHLANSALIGDLDKQRSRDRTRRATGNTTLDTPQASAATSRAYNRHQRTLGISAFPEHR